MMYFTCKGLTLVCVFLFVLVHCDYWPSSPISLVQVTYIDIEGRSVNDYSWAAVLPHRSTCGTKALRPVCLLTSPGSSVNVWKELVILSDFRRGFHVEKLVPFMSRLRLRLLPSAFQHIYNRRDLWFPLLINVLLVTLFLLCFLCN